jgi:hypothetical protein
MKTLIRSVIFAACVVGVASPAFADSWDTKHTALYDHQSVSQAETYKYLHQPAKHSGGGHASHH